MARIQTKRELSVHAVNFANTYSLVRCNNTLYIPADYETGDATVTPSPERTVWRVLTVKDVQGWAHKQYDVLFGAPADETNFFFMVAQEAEQRDTLPTSLLIRTEEGLRELKDDGQLHLPSGDFVPNFMPVMLNTNEADKQRVREVFHQWLDDPEEELSLLRHLATTLAPDWSAVKYVLLLGDGRNGKSLLMTMIQELFGWENCSHVSRQEISKASPTVTEVLNKLVNIVYDGVAEYLKDSGNEKSLIAGEPVSIRLLYASSPTMVTTNALFIEGLNREPRSNDKSSALQKRLVRFWFPNTFPDDLLFKQEMLSERMLGALLSLLIDHFVKKQDKSVMLAPTRKSIELSMEYMHANSYAIQFIAHMNTTDPLGLNSLIGMTITELTARFVSWRISEGDVNPWSEQSVYELFRPSVDFKRKSIRIHGAPSKVKVITDFKADTMIYLEYLKGDEADADATTEAGGSVVDG